MSRSRSRYIAYRFIPGQYPAESAGSLGRNDRADPNVATPAGSTGGPLGTNGDDSQRLAEGGGPAQQVDLPADIRVYIWSGATGEFGHGSLEVSGGLPKGRRYLSWWADGVTEIAGGRLMARTPEMDRETYGGRPGAVYNFPRLDATAIKAWLATQSRSYDLVTRNCATMVVEALQAGGAPPAPRPVAIWDPGLLDDYCSWMRNNVRWRSNSRPRFWAGRRGGGTLP